MATLNQYNLYSMNVGNTDFVRSDKVDKYLNELRRINDFEEVSDFVVENFGKIENVALLDFPELGKQMSIVVNEDKIEICAAKNSKQYYGKGWKLISQNS